jgi:hypothetical protein
MLSDLQQNPGRDGATVYQLRESVRKCIGFLNLVQHGNRSSRRDLQAVAEVVRLPTPPASTRILTNSAAQKSGSQSEYGLERTPNRQRRLQVSCLADASGYFKINRPSRYAIQNSCFGGCPEKSIGAPVRWFSGLELKVCGSCCRNCGVCS